MSNINNYELEVLTLEAVSKIIKEVCEATRTAPHHWLMAVGEDNTLFGKMTVFNGVSVLAFPMDKDITNNIVLSGFNRNTDELEKVLIRVIE